MFEVIKKEWSAKIAILIFLFFATWWILIQFPPANESRLVEYFGEAYGLMAVWGGIWGIIIARRWGWTKSVMGKAILAFSLGLFAQEFGQIMYSYYIYFLNQESYPSIGDIGYFGSIPLYTLGIVYLAKASGVRIGLKSFENKIQAVFIPLAMLAVGYFLFLQSYEFDWSNPLTVFLDFGYPLGQAIYVSVAILTYLLSRGVLGGVMKGSVLFILFALVLQFLSDYTFLYQTSIGTWRLGGENELMYLFSYFIMTFGLIRFGTVYLSLRGGGKKS